MLLHEPGPTALVGLPAAPFQARPLDAKCPPTTSRRCEAQWKARRSASSPQLRCSEYHCLPAQLETAQTLRHEKLVPTPSAVGQGDPYPGGLAKHQDGETMARESLRLLEWPNLCRQVAAFAETSLGAELLLERGAPMGMTLDESEALLQETEEATEAGLRFDGIYDIRPALKVAAMGDRCLTELQLAGVASTLEGAERLCHTVAGGGLSVSRFPALGRLAAGCGPEEKGLVTEIRRCIEPAFGHIADNATPHLADIRERTRANGVELQKSAKAWATQLHQQGVSERPIVVVRRGRECVAIKAGSQSQLPRGSVQLASSKSGSTLYMEPAPIVELNNRKAILSSEEAQEERSILMQLTRMLAACASRVADIMESVASLDVVNARAEHSKWLGGVRPKFLSTEQIRDGYRACLPQARHPILMQRALPPLREPPSASDAPFANNFREPTKPFQVDPPGDSAQQDSPECDLPVPIDLVVPVGTAVVALTGPNTGGKTASLKTLGLLTLMSKAGIFLPCGAALEGGPQPELMWFDQVLADIGDDQNLQQSLSTFSGHIRRVNKILHTATSASLVVLDEVGSGTDPTEGSVLAEAILDHLAGQAALTVATTHHSSIKEMADCDDRFVNASVGFDGRSLRPTYVLAWGDAGKSNALDISAQLGFDPVVVEAARELVAEMRGKGTQEAETPQLHSFLTAKLDAAVKEADKDALALQAAGERLKGLQESIRQLQAEESELQDIQGNADALQVAISKEVQDLLDGARSGRIAVESVKERLRELETEVAATSGKVSTDRGVQKEKDGGAPQIRNAAAHLVVFARI
ncbi:unnamed protein product [Ostreobium quekettii]|uniref:DNA mismatch repair proteins mutS family domain-containing protein n=1 Tax=Ostreobium quekettii TaxID=121088 RepID=A0A8S1IX83_9CHLO|nr:unnamed protein product [Ostreobium quekettii]